MGSVAARRRVAEPHRPAASLDQRMDLRFPPFRDCPTRSYRATQVGHRPTHPRTGSRVESPAPTPTTLANPPPAGLSILPEGYQIPYSHLHQDPPEVRLAKELEDRRRKLEIQQKELEALEERIKKHRYDN